MDVAFTKDRFAAHDPSGWDGSLTLSFQEDGSLKICSEQEHAVDSYNETFTNSYTFSPDVARMLTRWFKSQ